MPKEINLEEVLDLTTDKKSSKKCDKKSHKKNPCNVECCVPDCNPECCTAAFQRLDKLRQLWQLTQYNLDVPETVYNRAGSQVSVPSSEDEQPGSCHHWGTLERSAYAFVNEVRYLNFEECGKLDQVTGWSIDVQSGNMYFYQNLPELGLTTCLSRKKLLDTKAEEVTPIVKKHLAAMEPFWKLSLKVVERVRENPKTEGNICEIKDKCGNKFLVVINRARGQSCSGICEYNSQYSLVVVKLC
jgi:hypothetical protein